MTEEQIAEIADTIEDNRHTIAYLRQWGVAEGNHLQMLTTSTWALTLAFAQWCAQNGRDMTAIMARSEG